jgi:hypothetical protein
VQLDAPLAEKDPGGQAKQAEEDTDELKGLYLPASQRVTVPEDRNLPAVTVEHLVAPSTEYVPGGQETEPLGGVMGDMAAKAAKSFFKVTAPRVVARKEMAPFIVQPPLLTSDDRPM